MKFVNACKLDYRELYRQQTLRQILIFLDAELKIILEYDSLITALTGTFAGNIVSCVLFSSGKVRNSYVLDHSM